MKFCMRFRIMWDCTTGDLCAYKLARSLNDPKPLQTRTNSGRKRISWSCEKITLIVPHTNTHLALLHISFLLISSIQIGAFKPKGPGMLACFCSENTIVTTMIISTWNKCFVWKVLVGEGLFRSTWQQDIVAAAAESAIEEMPMCTEWVCSTDNWFSMSLHILVNVWYSSSDGRNKYRYPYPYNLYMI